MQIQNIGLMSPGDMGQAIATQLLKGGFRVCTALDSRSERSRALARDAGIVDLGSIRRLTAECDAVLSVMTPGAVIDFAQEIAGALRANRRSTLFVDCNAIAPDTMRTVAELVGAAGGRCLDAGIIGPPPRGDSKTALYVSGPGAGDLKPLATPQLAVHVLSDRIGDASALKMCYGSITKGTTALVLESLVVARRLGVESALETELKQSRGDIYSWVMGSLPAMPPKAYRWVPEMQQVAQTFASAGMTPLPFQGAAHMYRFIAATSLGRETPENRDRSRSGKEVVRLLAEERALASEAASPAPGNRSSHA